MWHLSDIGDYGVDVERSELDSSHEAPQARLLTRDLPRLLPFKKIRRPYSRRVGRGHCYCKDARLEISFWPFNVQSPLSEMAHSSGIWGAG